MTGDEMFSVCLQQIGHTKESNPIASDYFLGILNVCLAECMNTEKAYRLMNDLPALGDFGYVREMSSEVGFSDYILLNVVSKGVAARLAGEEDNQMLADYYGTMYENAKVRALGCMYTDTENVAEGGEIDG